MMSSPVALSSQVKSTYMYICIYIYTNVQLGLSLLSSRFCRPFPGSGLGKYTGSYVTPSD